MFWGCGKPAGQKPDVGDENHAASVAADPSMSLARRRHLPHQAKVRSTTQRRGKSWKPLTP